MKVGAVDCTAEKQTCDEFQVQGGWVGWVGGWAMQRDKIEAEVHGAVGQAQRQAAHPHVCPLEAHRPLPAPRVFNALTRPVHPSITPYHPTPPGFPTIKFFGENKDSPQDYTGGRDAGSLSSFALERWAAQQPPPEVRAREGRLQGCWWW